MCRVPNGTHGAVRGRGLITPSYSIASSGGIPEYEFGFELDVDIGILRIDAQGMQHVAGVKTNLMAGDGNR